MSVLGEPEHPGRTISIGTAARNLCWCRQALLLSSTPTTDHQTATL